MTVTPIVVVSDPLADPNPLQPATFPVNVDTRASLGRGEAVDAAIREVAAQSGVPPQFLKSQAQHESSFDPSTYRYEPITVDFQYVSSDVGENGVLPRDNALYADRTTHVHYIRRHMLPGSGAIVMSNRTPANASCVVILGPATLTGGTGCREIALADTTQWVQVLGPSQLVVGKAGLPNSRDGSYVWLSDVTATLVSPQAPPAVPTETPLAPVAAPGWTSAAGPSPGVPPQPGQFSFDYGTNSVLLGRPLTPGEYVKLTYHPVTLEQLDPNVQAWQCPPFDVQQLKVGRLDFTPRQSIGSWLKTNRVRTGNAILRNIDGAQFVEFNLVPGLPPPLMSPGLTVDSVVADSRLRGATAQFVAGGSFGLMQATISDWLTPARIPFVNAVFDLGTHCLPGLGDPANSNRVEQALRLAVASHTYAMTTKAAPTGQYDQLDWAKYWSQVFQEYNRYGEMYCSAPFTNSAGRVTRACDKARMGLSKVVQDGIEAYGPR